MDEKEFKIKPELKSGIVEVDEYLEQIHEYLLKSSSSSIKQLIVSLDKVAMKMVHDLNLIIKGDIKEPDIVTSYLDEKTQKTKTKTIEGASKLTILGDDSKIYEKTMGLINKIEDFRKLNQVAEAMRPEVEEMKSQLEDTKINLDVHSNVFEQLQEQHYKKNKTK